MHIFAVIKSLNIIDLSINIRQRLMEADERDPTSFQSLIETVFEIADNQEQQRLVEIKFALYPTHLLGSYGKWLSIHYVIGLTMFMNCLWFVMLNFT